MIILPLRPARMVGGQKGEIFFKICIAFCNALRYALFMNTLHKKVADEMSIHFTKEFDIKKYWDHDAPHFGGTTPHRYESTIKIMLGFGTNEKICIYCGRPETYQKGGLDE